MSTTTAENLFSWREPKTKGEYEIAIGFLLRELKRQSEEMAEGWREIERLKAEGRACLERLRAMPSIHLTGRDDAR